MVGVGPIKSRFAHGTLRFMVPSIQNAKSSDRLFFRRVRIYRNRTIRIDVAGAELTRPLRGRPQFGKP
jgi:hypothetical protein